MAQYNKGQEMNMSKVTNFVIDYECGNLDEEEVISGFQYLIDTGVVWQLQGSYGRMANRLIECGLCSAD